MNQRGFTIAEGLVGAALVATISAGAMYLVKQSSDMQTQLATIDAGNKIRTMLISEMRTESAWTKTQNMSENSGKLSCVTLKSDCSGRKTQTPIAISSATLDSAGNPIKLTDPDLPLMGFDLDGNVCGGFDKDNGNVKCPFRVETSWRAVCPATGPCDAPEIELFGKFIYKAPPGLGAVVNDHVLSFHFMRGNLDGYYSSCVALGGEFTTSSSECVLPIEGKCPYGIVLGIDPVTHRKNCGLPIAGPIDCGTGNVLTAIDENGTPRCVPLICNPLRKCEKLGNCPCEGLGCDGYTFDGGDGGGGGGDGDGGCDGGGADGEGGCGS